MQHEPGTMLNGGDQGPIAWPPGITYSCLCRGKKLPLKLKEEPTLHADKMHVALTRSLLVEGSILTLALELILEMPASSTCKSVSQQAQLFQVGGLTRLIVIAKDILWLAVRDLVVLEPCSDLLDLPRKFPAHAEVCCQAALYMFQACETRSFS